MLIIILSFIGCDYVFLVVPAKEMSPGAFTYMYVNTVCISHLLGQF